MVKYACEEHIDELMDEIINEYETFPVMEKEESDKKCSYCSNVSVYKVLLDNK